MENKYKKLLSNTLIFAIGNFGSKLIMFFFVPLYTNVLSTNEYGIAELVTTFSTLLVPIISLGIGEAVLRFGLYKDINKNAVIKNSFIVLICGSVLMVIISPLLGLYKPINDYIVELVTITILTAFRTSLQYYAKAIDKNKVFAVDSILYTFILALFNVIFLIAVPLGISGYLLSYIIAGIISCLYLTLRSIKIKNIIIQNIDFSLLKKMLKYSAPLIANSISWWVFHSTDKIMIQHYISNDAVGLYTVASKIPSLVNTVTYFFSQAWTISAISEYDEDRDVNYYNNTFRYFNSILCIIISALLLVLKPFMSVYVGPNFLLSWQFVPLLLVAAVFQNYSNFFGPFFSSANKNMNVMLTTLAGAGANVILNAVLIPKIGSQGAVIATVISYAIVSVYRILASRKYLPIKIEKLSTFGSVLLIVVQSICVGYEFHSLHISIVTIILICLLNFTTYRELINAGLRITNYKILRRKEK